jgi:peptidoglycan/xylan/chitin deacetylase (PgdA/CDA1 family)
LKIGIQAPPSDSEAIRELLSPWSISFAEPEDAQLNIVYKQKPVETTSLVVIPSESTSFTTWTKEANLKTKQQPGNILFVAATSQTALTVTPNTQYNYDDSAKTAFQTSNPTDIKIENDVLALKLDIVQEFKDILNKTLNPKQSKLHELVTGLPIPYGLSPKWLRNLLMKTDKNLENLALCDKLPIDALRFMLVDAIETASGKQLEKKPLFAQNYVCLLTHDVETAKGLQRSRIIKKIEERYDARSAWFLPSNRYKLNSDAVRELANNGEIGAHDTKHDGKLVHLSKQKLLERLIAARQTLGGIAQQPVEGFRAPILQHNQMIIQALGEAGYLYDTSIPAWEPKHPYTMKPHGIGTVYPLKLGGLTEIPLTLPQDHQLLQVLGLKGEEVLKTWAVMASVIRDLGGVCMFLVHPEYELATEKPELYEELVCAVSSDPQATITVPSRICDLMNE